MEVRVRVHEREGLLGEADVLLIPAQLPVRVTELVQETCPRGKSSDPTWTRSPPSCLWTSCCPLQLPA